MAAGRRLLIFCLVLLVGLAAGCGSTRSIPELLTITDITPRSFGPNDRIDVAGRNLPVGQVGAAQVVLRGDLYRPGEAPLFDQVIEVDDARLERDRITFEVTDSLLERFTGRGDAAKHTTFRGRVEVRLPGASASMPVVGSLHGDVVLDAVPRDPSKRASQAQAERVAQAQSFFGWSLERVEGSRGGLLVRSVRADSPAAHAGVVDGDVIVAFAGVNALSPSDAIPSGLEGKTPFVVERGDQRIDLTLDTQAFRGDVETGLTEGVVVLATLLLMLLLFGTRIGRAISWLAHRLKNEIAKQRTHGGSFVGALVRAAVHDATKNPRARGTLSLLAPAFVAVGVSVSFAALPFVELKRRAELDIGILYLVSVTALLAMGLLTGGWGSSRSPIRGRARAVIEVFVCELPAACALGAIVVMTGSFHVRDIVLAQVGSGGAITETGGWPWAWNALRSPQLFFLFGLFFVTALIDASPTTFGGAERSTDKMSQAGGRSLGALAFFFAEWTHVFVMCGLGTMAFLGGYAVPGFGVRDLDASAWLKVAGCGLFLVKCWLLVLTVLVVRASLPRIRPNVVLRVGLRTLLPACLVAIAVTAISLRFPLLPAAERTLGLVTMSTSVAAVGLVVAWVFASVRRADEGRFRARVGNPLPTRSRVNPFL